MSSQIDKFNQRQQRAEEERKKRAKANRANSSEAVEDNKTETDNKKTNDLSELGNIVDVSTLTEPQQGNTGDTTMADEFKISDADKTFLQEYLDKSGKKQDLEGISEEDFKTLMAEAKKNSENSEEEKAGDEKNQDGDVEKHEAANDNEPEKPVLEKKEGAQVSNDSEWVKKMDTHWKGWCEDREGPKYIYERDAEQKEGYSFKYYKNSEDKAAGKPATEVHYKTESDVEIKTADGKPADYEFWKSFANAAKKNEQVVNFEKMGKAENKSRLYLACVVQGVGVKNANLDDMNFEESFKYLSDEEKKIAQAKLGLDENGAKIVKETEGQEKPKDEEIKQEESKQEESKQVNIAKDRIAELRNVLAGRKEDKDGKVVYDSDDLQKYQESKAKTREDMKDHVRDSKDETKTDAERQSSKDSYDAIKKTLIDNAIKNKKVK